MSYGGFPPNELAFWVAQQAQQENVNHSQALPNQFSIPQPPLPSISRPLSYPTAPQVQLPTGGFSNNVTSTYPAVPFPMPYAMAPLPVQFPQVPFLNPGLSAPAHGSIDHNRRSAPPYNEAPSETQQLVPMGTLQQNHAPPPRENPLSGTYLVTIDPDFGPCALVPIDEMRALANHVRRHRDYHSNRLDRLRRRHSRELTPYMRSMTPSPHRSPVLSPYLLSPSSSVTATPFPRHRHRSTPNFVRSPSSFRGIGGFTPLRRPQSVPSVPLPTREASISTVGTCSQCGRAESSDPYEPMMGGSVATTPRDVRGESSRVNGETQEESAAGRSRFQASVEDIDE